MDEYSKYIKENTMTESEYKEWFNTYLGDVETGFETNLDSPILNAPKLFNFWKWFIILSAITFVSIGLSALFYFLPQAKIEWLSNACLSIGTGIIASIIILIFTQAREKNITYLNDIVPLLQTRHRKMSDAIYYDMGREAISSQNGIYEVYFACYQRFKNTYCVIVQFYKLLCETAKYKPKYLTAYLKYLDDDWEQKNAYEQKVYANYNSQNADNNLMDLANEKLKVERLIISILDVLDYYIKDLRAKLYHIKYNKANKTKTIKEQEAQIKKIRKHNNKKPC